MEKRYYDLNAHLRERFGQRVQKLTVDAGLSCPNRDGTLSTGGCIFCNARGSGTGMSHLSVTEQLTRAREYMARRYKAKKFIAYFQAFTNTYAPVERLQALYDEALAVPGVVGLSIGTRPDCVDGQKLALLQEYAQDHLIWLEYGLQSAHDRTLAAINRGHDFACFQRAVQASQGRNINICAHVILGLPGEGRAEMVETARKLAELAIDGVKLHLLYVVRGTVLARMYQSGCYRCLSQAEYVERVCDVLEHLPPSTVIHRLTGDPHRDELIAPAWSLQKQDTLSQIQNRLSQRRTWQGRLA